MTAMAIQRLHDIMAVETPVWLVEDLVCEEKFHTFAAGNSG